MRNDSQTLNQELSQDIILFDGVCNLCNGAIRFIIERDPKDRFRFASLQSETGKKLLKKYKIDPKRTDSIVLITVDNKAYTRSDAALQIARVLRGWPQLLYFFKIIPGSLRDGMYKFIARNRYRWFGKQQQCMIPSPHLKQKFLN